MIPKKYIISERLSKFYKKKKKKKKVNFKKIIKCEFYDFMII